MLITGIENSSGLGQGQDQANIGAMRMNPYLKGGGGGGGLPNSSLLPPRVE